MDLEGLSKETKLYQLLQKCEIEHELVITECHDGALILECYLCPFVHTLTTNEEEFVRERVEVFRLRDQLT